jgi:hypothetical protein
MPWGIKDTESEYAMSLRILKPESLTHIAKHKIYVSIILVDLGVHVKEMLSLLIYFKHFYTSNHKLTIGCASILEDDPSYRILREQTSQKWS